MRRLVHALLLALAAGGVAAAAAGARPGAITCTDAFSGTARDVVVPAENDCDLSGARITHDLIVEDGAGVFALGLSVGHDVRLAGSDDFEVGGAAVGHDVVVGAGSGLHLERATIGHDLSASAPDTVQTGKNAPASPGGPVRVGHDLRIDGTSGDEFVFDGMCGLDVGHHVRITNRAVTLGIGFGDECAFRGQAPNTIGHDLVFSNDSALVGFFGPSALEIGNNRVGHDLVVTGNTAAPGGFLEVADNVVGHDAICAANDPAPSKEPWDGPNLVAGRNTCG